jgi:NADH pyrophosphatase NudC (nudix superfamily)
MSEKIDFGKILDELDEQMRDQRSAYELALELVERLENETFCDDCGNLTEPRDSGYCATCEAANE